MKINWVVRFKNPVFLAQITMSVFFPILAYFGLHWEDMTTWGAIGNLIFNAISNPVVLVAVIISILNAINDPTTKGLSDSSRALNHTEIK